MRETKTAQLVAWTAAVSFGVLYLLLAGIPIFFMHGERFFKFMKRVDLHWYLYPLFERFFWLMEATGIYYRRFCAGACAPVFSDYVVALFLLGMSTLVYATIGYLLVKIPVALFNEIDMGMRENEAIAKNTGDGK